MNTPRKVQTGGSINLLGPSQLTLVAKLDAWRSGLGAHSHAEGLEIESKRSIRPKTTDLPTWCLRAVAPSVAR